MEEARILELLEPVLASFDLELDALEVRGRGRYLTVVVDGDGPDGRGPLLDDIAEAAKAVSATLDASDATGSAPYTLEVTSRGTDRPLTAPQHWRRNAGRLVSVRGADGRTLLGRIVDSDARSVELEGDGGRHRVSFEDVGSARVQAELRKPKEG